MTHAPTRRTTAKRLEPIQERMERTIHRNRFWLIACVLLYLLPTGFIGGTLLLSGIVLFFVSQSERRERRFWGPARLTAAALACCCAPDLGIRCDVGRQHFWRGQETEHNPGCDRPVGSRSAIESGGRAIRDRGRL